MSTLPEQAARRPSAWGDPDWVSMLMLYPHETEAFKDCESALKFFNTRLEIENSIVEERLCAGQVAGNVLLALYVLTRSPWKIAKPSLSRAIAAAEKMLLEEEVVKDRRWPRGHTKIEECFNAMRPVAHLWGADRLTREFLHKNLREIDSNDALSLLLGLGRTLQAFALEWKPPGTKPDAVPSHPLLGDSPWLVPDHIPPLCPRWEEGSRPKWLLKANATYRRRPRGD